MTDPETEGEDPEALPEDSVTFEGPCTCEHDPSEHGWTGCNEPGCECEARWSE